MFSAHLGLVLGLFLHGDLQHAVLEGGLNIIFLHLHRKPDGAGPGALSAFPDVVVFVLFFFLLPAFGVESQKILFQGQLNLVALKTGQFGLYIEVFLVFVHVQMAGAFDRRKITEEILP